MVRNYATVLKPGTAAPALYVYIGLAQADGPMEPSERATIFRKMAGVNRLNESEINAMIERVALEQAGRSQAEVWAGIAEACHELCHSEAEKQGLLHDLEEIMECDGRVKELEMSMFRRIHSVLG